MRNWRDRRAPRGRSGVRGASLGGRVSSRPGARRRAARHSVRRAEEVLFGYRGAELRLPRHHVESFLHAFPLDACVDLVRRGIFLRGAFVELRSRETAFGILAALARAGGEVVPPPRLFEEVWGRPARNEHDLKAVYLHVWRLRERLCEVSGPSLVQTADGGYRLDPRRRVAAILPVARPRRAVRAVTDAGAAAVLALVAERGALDSRGLKQAFGASLSTARRLLRKLTDEGRLVRTGSGRATAYRIAP